LISHTSQGNRYGASSWSLWANPQLRIDARVSMHLRLNANNTQNKNAYNVTYNVHTSVSPDLAHGQATAIWGNEIKETLREDCSREIIPSLSFSLVSFSFFCQNCFLYFVENCVISTPIILQCRSVADLHLGGLGEGRAQDGGRLSIVVKLPAKLPPLSSRREDPWQPPPFAACPPAVCYIVCFFLFVFLASQSSEQRTCLFFLFLPYVIVCGTTLYSV